MPCGNFLLCHMSQFRTIIKFIMDDGDQYFKKNAIFMSKFFHNAMCQILMDE
jgi:hypothetical protein